MAQDFDAELSNIETELSALRARMAAEREEWIKLAAPWLAEYWQEQARAVVVDQAAHANEIGKPAVQSIRAEVENLAERAEPILVERLVSQNGERLWPDLKPQIDTADGSFGTGYGTPFRVYLRSGNPNFVGNAGDVLQAPEQLRTPMRGIQDEALPILRTQGFVTSHHAYGNNEVLFRRLSKPWSREMVESINRYADHHAAYLEELSDKRTAMYNKSQTEAADLWDGN